MKTFLCVVLSVLASHNFFLFFFLIVLWVVLCLWITYCIHCFWKCIRAKTNFPKCTMKNIPFPSISEEIDYLSCFTKKEIGINQKHSTLIIICLQFEKKKAKNQGKNSKSGSDTTLTTKIKVWTLCKTNMWWECDNLLILLDIYSIEDGTKILPQ